MKYLEIGGQRRPFSFGMGALMAFEKKSGKQAMEAFSEVSTGSFSISDAVMLIACGLENGARKDGNPQSFNPFDVADWLDENPALLTEAFEELGASFATQSDDGKKKTARLKNASTGTT